jgi:uroporphyrinogen-III decarboxylase
VDLAAARTILGPGVKVSGNVDPTILFAPERTIRDTVAIFETINPFSRCWVYRWWWFIS